jgi:hypothetical protein
VTRQAQRRRERVAGVEQQPDGPHVEGEDLSLFFRFFIFFNVA